MSSDYFADNDNLDYSTLLAEVDAIEAAHMSHRYHMSSSTLDANKPFTMSSIPHPFNRPSILDLNGDEDCQSKDGSSRPAQANVGSDDSFDDYFDDIDTTELEEIDMATEVALKNNTKGFISGSNHSFRAGSGLSRQLTLTGEILDDPPTRVAHPSVQRMSSRTSHTLSFGNQSRKIKKWDHTAFAKTGWKSGKARQGKGKGVLEVDENGMSNFAQFSSPQNYNISEPTPFRHKVDLLEAGKWLYPTNKPKRDYQFNIARKSLFENTLVALPTGLGKTFIAGVVMLNYYRWFPEGKLVFVAPTKPLVTQQRDACHKCCGIPDDEAIELTGQVSRQLRAQAWMQKRVFFMTPQTLINDLRTETCNPSDIVLLVIDEAHKATGDYAYCQIIRYLMATSGCFRVLALTATPGSKPEAVQAIVDSLHISHIEIRDENSLDLRDYVLPKKITTHVVKMTPYIIKIRDMLSRLMRKVAKRLIESNLCSDMDMVTLHPYRCNILMQQYGQDGTGKRFPWVFPSLKKLSSLARAMGYLLECSISICYSELQIIASSNSHDRKKRIDFRSEPLFSELIQVLEQQHILGFPPHPKLEKLEGIAVDYFAQTSDNIVEADSVTDPATHSKMMVFTNFRASVDEIVEVLNKQSPLIRAVRFIGQGVDKNGKRGIAQKDQLEVIKQFKEGIYNVLVATSIGEEGLDIGEVDIIVCYDAQKTPIRMLQRVGRTGRKRAGRVEVLLAESREEANWDKAKNDYQSVQASILRGDSIELFQDVCRLLPEKIRPECVESKMPIYEYVRPTLTAVPKGASKGTKRKRNDDSMSNVPDGAHDGFIASSKLLEKHPHKRSKTKRLEDLTDQENGIAIRLGMGVITLPGGNIPSKKRTNRLSKNKGRGKERTKDAVTEEELSLSQLDRELQDDSDDMRIEQGVALSSPLRSSKQIQASIGSQRNFSPSSFVTKTSSLENPIHRSHDDAWLLDSDDGSIIGLSQGQHSSSGSDISTLHEKISGCSTVDIDIAHQCLRSQESAELQSPINILSKGRQNREVVQNSVAASTSSFSEASPILRKTKQTHRHQIVSSSQDTTTPKVQMDGSSAQSPHHRKPIYPPVGSQVIKKFLDIEAEVSGEDVSSSGPENAENESDRCFVGDFLPTQAPQGYNQNNVYRQSLMTQAPQRDAPRFISKPVGLGRFGPFKPQTTNSISSSPPLNTTPDQYSIDSFVVEDDDDIILRVETESSTM